MGSEMCIRDSPGTVYIFALEGKNDLTVQPSPKAEQTLVEGVPYDPELVGEGTALYVSNCVFCHGVPGVDPGGNIPNLGYVDESFIRNLDKFVLSGPFTSLGMPDFTGKLSKDDVEKIKAFIMSTADAVRGSK